MREKGWLAYQKVGTAGELGTKKKKKRRYKRAQMTSFTTLFFVESTLEGTATVFINYNNEKYLENNKIAPYDNLMY